MATVSPALGKFFPSPGVILSIVTPILIAVEVNVLYVIKLLVGRKSVRSIEMLERTFQIESGGSKWSITPYQLTENADSGTYPPM